MAALRTVRHLVRGDVLGSRYKGSSPTGPPAQRQEGIIRGEALLVYELPL